MNRIYFEALMVTIKIGKRIRLYIFSFCFLNFLFFSLRGYEIFLFWVSCFYFCKITVFITGNAPLILKILNSKTDIYFFLILEILFFSWCFCQRSIPEPQFFAKETSASTFFDFFRTQVASGVGLQTSSDTFWNVYMYIGTTHDLILNYDLF